MQGVRGWFTGVRFVRYYNFVYLMVFLYMRDFKMYLFGLAFIGFTIAGLCYAFLSPADYKHGELVRIMYIHVPSAWMSLSIFTVISVSGFVHLIWNRGALLARAIAPCGLGFTLICLVTGSIWGKYTWGAWWVWDARLTSMLFMMVTYVAYVMLWNLFSDTTRASFVTSLFAIFGAINVPIVKFSVDMWATLHQGSSFFRKGGPAIDALMQMPLLIMLCGFVAFACLFTALRMHSLTMDEKIKLSVNICYRG